MSSSVRSIDLPNTGAAYHAPGTLTSQPARWLHISGQPGARPDGSVPPDYESQIHLALLAIHKVMAAAETSVKDIAKLTVYIVNYDPQRRKHVRHIQRFLRSHRPAMTLVPVTQLAVPSWLVEIEAAVAKPFPLQSQLLAPSQKIWDVVVIGAGLAGLTAADHLSKAGYSCLVLEARDRVGGRTWSKLFRDGRGVVDVGAAWINDTNQRKAFELAKRAGAELVEQNTTGNCLLQDASGGVHQFQYGGLPFDSETQKHIASIRDRVEADCQQVDCARPEDHILDSMTFLAYLKSLNANEQAISTASIWTRAMLGQEPEDVSALYFLNYCKSGGGLLQMRSDRRDGAQYLRLRQGTQSMAKALANDLPANSVRLSTPVTAVHQQSEGPVLVQTSSEVVPASRVISAMPATVLKTIDFQPPLPARKQLLVDSFHYGYYTKVMIAFRSAFWVTKGFCGLVQSFNGPVSVIRDSSIPQDNKWVLTCFVSGDSGRRWSQLDHKERENSILDHVGDIYGSRAQVHQEAVSIEGHQWVEEQYSGFGCPCPSLSPGVLTAAGNALREPFQRVHFIGTETAAEWKGYMEGAIRSGERGAAEVQRYTHNARL